MNIYLQKKQRRLNSFSVTLLLIVAAIGYAGYALIPVYWPVFQLAGIMRGIANEAYRNFNDQDLLVKLVRESRRVNLPGLSAENFEIRRIPYDAEELREAKGANADKRGKRCEISFYYERDFTWPFIGRTSRLTFEREVGADLAFVEWDNKNKTCTCVSVPAPSAHHWDSRGGR